MYRIARFIIMLVAMINFIAVSTGCDLMTKPEDKLYHFAIFNDGQDDVKVQCLNPDVSGQGKIVTLIAGQAGVASWDIKKYPHTFVFTHIVTGQVLRTISIEPNSIKGERSHDGINNLDAFYSYATGEYQN